MDNNTNNVQTNPNLNNLVQTDNSMQNINENSMIQNNANVSSTMQSAMNVQSNQQSMTVQPTPVVIEQANLQTQNPQSNIQPHVDIEAHIKDQLQNIPTVEQNKQDFINNVQNMNQETNEQKKEGINFVFIIILFVVILAAIYFLFPILLKYI